MRVEVSRKDSDIPDGYVCVGEVMANFGLRGEFKVFLSNPQSTLFNKAKPVRLLLSDGSHEDLKMSIRSGAGKKIIGRITSVFNRTEADRFIGSKILYETKRLPKLDHSEWYHFQIIGLPVSTNNGEVIGKVTEIVPGDVEIWVAEGDEYKIYIPFTDDDVLSVSLDDGIVIPDLDE